MASNNKRRDIYKQQARHQYSSRGGKLRAGLDLIIFDNGDIEFSVLRPLTLRHKPEIEISNADIAKIETSISPGNYTHVSIKITDSSGNIEVVRPLMIGFKNKRSAIVAKLPVILSSLYGERYTKL